jgi:hypothetical protein
VSFSAIFEENKVQACLKLLQENPGIKTAEATRQTRALYSRVLRRLKGILGFQLGQGREKFRQGRDKVFGMSALQPPSG